MYLKLSLLNLNDLFNLKPSHFNATLSCMMLPTEALGGWLEDKEGVAGMDIRKRMFQCTT